MLAPCRRKIVLMLNPSAQTCSDAFEWKLFREHQFLRIWLGSKRPSCSGRWQTATVVRKKFKIKAIREVYFKWEILQVLKPFKNCLPFSTKSCVDIVKRRAVSLQIRIRFFVCGKCWPTILQTKDANSEQESHNVNNCLQTNFWNETRDGEGSGNRLPLIIIDDSSLR